ncbi:phospholipase D-like domain-containing protein [Halovivax gelatinilyticus]|uniref:phospholipase D-like domain-containing protein n=1 Tax=Halovivax gelatinilyticus TaxID=2961597 RepID=UPI0020CA9596|nr:phospholipase D-like domain-containing protein [Halovivax gelatinilyticus]
MYDDHIAICTPWLSDVDVRLPLAPGVDDRSTKLAAAIRNLDTQVDVYVRPDESANEYALSRLAGLENVTVTTVPDIHAKAVITDAYVYVGSANITRGGLLTNLELCKVVENEFADVQSYIEAELDI